MDAMKILFGIKEYMIERRDKSPGYGRIWFKAVSGKPLTPEQIFDIQNRLGYHPDGYGTMQASSTPFASDEKDSGWVTKWCCSASCD